MDAEHPEVAGCPQSAAPHPCVDAAGWEHSQWWVQRRCPLSKVADVMVAVYGVAASSSMSVWQRRACGRCPGTLANASGAQQRSSSERATTDHRMRSPAVRWTTLAAVVVRASQMIE